MFPRVRRFAALLSFYIFIVVTAATDSKTTPRNFVQAENRVGDLISKLDSVSNHASRAKDEIHSTLRELWQIVDLLGRDRCGDVVERVRVLQRKAAARVQTLELELSKQDEVIVQLRTEVRARTIERDEFSSKNAALQNEIAKLKEEIIDLTEKHRKTLLAKDKEGAYKIVVERLGEVRVANNERQDMLKRVLQMLEQERSMASETGTKVESALEGLRATETDSGDSATEARLRKELQLVNQQLRAVKLEREDGSEEIATLQREMKRIRAHTKSHGSGEQVVFREGDEGYSWAGTFSLIFISLATGCFLVYTLFATLSFRFSWPPAGGGASPTDPGKFSSYTPTQRTPEGFVNHRNSPHTQFRSNDSNKSTPHSGTPRLY